MKENISHPIVESMRISNIAMGKSSFGHALFKSLKSTHIRICLFFFSHGNNTGDPCGIFYFSNEASSYKLIIFSFYLWEKLQVISLVLVSPVDSSFAWLVDASQLMGPDLAFLHTTMQKHPYSQK
jgi:hypothetical protein